MLYTYIYKELNLYQSKLSKFNSKNLIALLNIYIEKRKLLEKEMTSLSSKDINIIQHCFRNTLLKYYSEGI